MAKQTAKHAASRLDIHQKVTDTISAAIEAGQGDGEWTMPWHRPGTSFTIVYAAFGLL